MCWLLIEKADALPTTILGAIELSNTNSLEQSELIRLALAGIDAEIASLQEKRAQLLGLTNQKSTSAKKVSATPVQKSGGMSEEAKAKISAAAKARWAKVKQAQAKAAKQIPTVKKAQKKKAVIKKSPSKSVKAAKKVEPEKTSS